MSTLFQSYVEEYTEACKQVEQQCAALAATIPVEGKPAATAPPSGGRASMAKDLAQMITRLRELTASMEFEANDVNLSQRQEVKQRVAEYKKKVFTLEKEVARLKNEASRVDREDLLGGAATGPTAATIGQEAMSQRVQLANNTQRMKDSTHTLKKAERLVEDSEDLADQSLAHLNKQRETIQNIRGKTREVDEEVSQARRIVTQMQKVMIQNKAVMVAIILVLLFMIFIIIYVKTSGGSSEATPAPGSAISPPPQPSEGDYLPGTPVPQQTASAYYRR